MSGNLLSKSGSPIAVLAVVLGIAGCSSPEESPSPEEYTEPAWMAQVRAQDEEYTTAMTACLKGKGQNPAVSGGMVGLSHAAGATVESSAADRGIAERAWEECSAQIPEQDYKSSGSWGGYSQLLDIQTCLTHEGYELPEPPSEEAWAEANSGSRYEPHSYLLTLTVDGKRVHSPSDFHRMVDACPMGTVSSIFVAGPSEIGE